MKFDDYLNRELPRGSAERAEHEHGVAKFLLGTRLQGLIPERLIRRIAGSRIAETKVFTSEGSCAPG